MTNVEQLMKEFDEGVPKEDTDEKYFGYKWTDWARLRKFVFHAHNEGYKAGLAKAVEVMEKVKKNYTWDKGECSICGFNSEVYDETHRCGVYNEALSDINSSLTQLITSNNEEKDGQRN